MVGGVAFESAFEMPDGSWRVVGFDPNGSLSAHHADTATHRCTTCAPRDRARHQSLFMCQAMLLGFMSMHMKLYPLQRFDMIYDGNDKSSGLPRGMPLVTCTFASSEHA